LKGWYVMNALITTKNRKLSWAFVAIWFLANVVLTWLLAVGRVSFAFDNIWIVILVLLPCNVFLMYLIRNPIVDEPLRRKTHKGKLLGLIAVVVIALLLLQAVVGKFILFLFPVVAAVILWLLKPHLDKQDWLYATFLALIAGVAGLGAEWISFITPVQWGFLQVPLTLLSFLAGWSILRRFGLLQQGVGRSRFLTAGIWPALQSFLLGILLGTPWALATVVMGSAEGGRSAWAESWWQPLIALQPGIAEEAWGRLLMVPLAFLLFRRVSPDRTAFSTALIVMAYWFAYLHVSGNVVSVLVSTFIIGSLLTLPISIVCLYHDLETAIGFHFWMDFLKFAFALFLFNR
jgi:hypothetical protein